MFSLVLRICVCIHVSLSLSLPVCLCSSLMISVSVASRYPHAWIISLLGGRWSLSTNYVPLVAMSGKIYLVGRSSSSPSPKH